jgi:hypothetical protein
MAVVYPLANGNWSTVANWYSGGVAYGQLPLSTDDVYLDNKTLTLDVDVTIANMYFTARSGGTAGGLINCSTTRTVTCTNIQAYGSNNGINFTGTTGTLLTVNANFLAGAFNDGGTNGVIKLTSSGNVNVNGNLVGGTTGNVSSVYITGSGLCTIVGNLTGANIAALVITLLGRAIVTGNVNSGGISCSGTTTSALIVNGLCIPTAASTALSNTSSGTVTINGNQTAVGTAGVYAITNSSAGVININGDCLGALSATPSLAYIVNNVSTGILNINGSVTARSVSPTAGNSLGIVNNASTGTINVSTNVTGGSVANTIGISNAALGIINVTGNVIGGSNATNTPALFTSTAGTFNITGTTTSNSFPAIYSTVTTAKFNLLGDVVNTAGVVAYYGSLIVKCSPTVGQSITYRSTSGSDRILATTNVSNGAPVIANVRYGIVYGSTNELTGTLRMALPSDVRVSVPTDNTVGTATITAQDFWDYAVSNLTAADSIGKRLKNCSTVQTTGDQIAAF